MAESVHKNSLDDDNRRFVPDEVFENIEEARKTIEFLMSVYESEDGPLVYPVLLKDKTNIGYVQIVPIEEEFEVGYHIASEYTKKGYATEALKTFLKYVMRNKKINRVYGICVSENISSIKVLEKCGFEKNYEGKGEYQGETRNIVKYIFDASQICPDATHKRFGMENIMDYGMPTLIENDSLEEC